MRIARLKYALGDCYRYREVLASLLERDFKVKYKRTFLGYVWSLFNPLLQLAVLSAVFSHVVKIEMKEYSLYLFSGLLGWNFFSHTLIAAGYSFVENESFIKKIYLPKLLFPLSRTLLRAFDFWLSVVALGLIGLVAGFTMKTTAVLLPVAFFWFFLFTFGVSVLCAVLEVYFRDVQYLLNVFLQLLYFATPIIYPISALPPSYQRWMELNPLYVELRIFQRLVHEGVLPSMGEWSSAIGVSLAALICGIGVFLLAEDDLVYRL